MVANLKDTSSRNRFSAGFSLVEVLIAVAVMVILFGVSFVAVQNHQRSVKQVELDAIAKEILIAAQNHLTLAESQGSLDELREYSADFNENDFNERLGNCFTTSESGGEGDSADSRQIWYYWFVGKNGGPKFSPHNTLYEMLPYGSIDEAVRSGGSYVIQYDLETATVISVFYSDGSNLSNFDFSDDNYKELFVDPGLGGDENHDTRLNVENGGVLGWYGGKDRENIETVELYPPTVKIINAERLKVLVSFDDVRERSQNAAVKGAYVDIIMYGNTSRLKRYIANNVPLDGSGPFSAGKIVTLLNSGVLKNTQEMERTTISGHSSRAKTLQCMLKLRQTVRL